MHVLLISKTYMWHVLLNLQVPGFAFPFEDVKAVGRRDPNYLAPAFRTLTRCLIKLRMHLAAGDF